VVQEPDEPPNEAAYNAKRGKRGNDANPLDPRLEEWKDLLEAWTEEMPKEPEE
jgi:hypothetical protein